MNQRISIIEVARHAGVSKSTVSRVISENGGSVSAEAQEKVAAAIRELGYTRNTLAAGLRSQRTWMMLVMVPDIANPYWSEIARAAQDALEAEGYSVVVGNTDWQESREARYFGLVRSGRFDGIVLNSVTDDLETIRGLGVPVVLVGERSISGQVDTVGTDTMAAARLAMEHLWERGYRKIAIATSGLGGERLLSLRRRAYDSFLLEKGLSPDPALAFSVKLSDEGGRELARALLALPGWRGKVDAVFCGNDILAISAMDALRKAGVETGRDLAVVGMDDIPEAAHVRPALSTVRKPRARIGSAAAELLLARIRDPGRPAETRLFPGELIVRDSVGGRKSGR